MKRQTCHKEPRDREQAPNNQNKSQELRRHSPIPNRTINYGKHYTLPPIQKGNLLSNTSKMSYRAEAARCPSLRKSFSGG